MSNLVTWGDMLAKIERDLDIEDETFVQSPELIGYGNEALHVAESLILRTREDYFLQSWVIAWISDQAAYPIPDGLYADKIRRIIYRKGTWVYTIKRLRQSFKFEAMVVSNIITAEPAERAYDLLNDSVAGRKIVFFPTPREATGAASTDDPVVMVWGLRSIKKIVDANSVIELPEFHSFIETYVKKCVLEKEGNPLLPAMDRNLEMEQQRLLESLGDRFPDDDTILEPDTSHYEEHN